MKKLKLERCTGKEPNPCPFRETVDANFDNKRTSIQVWVPRCNHPNGRFFINSGGYKNFPVDCPLEDY
jgi:hypothetical protein